MRKAGMRAAGKLSVALLLAALLLACPALCMGEGAANEADAASAAEDAAETGAGTATAAGTAVLLGAGAYTGLRMHSEKQKREREGRTPGYVTFENHTRDGTLTEEEKRAFNIGEGASGGFKG